VTSRLPNPRRVKIHFSYAVAEIASCCGVHKNTVRQWIKQGLPVVDGGRPVLVLGRDLRKFLEDKRSANKRVCRQDEIYCVRCRCPKVPAGNMVDYVPSGATAGAVIGICPDCELMMYRRTSLPKLEQLRRTLDVTLPKAHSRIGDSINPFVNSDFT
jgi:hypothetical protein